MADLRNCFLVKYEMAESWSDESERLTLSVIKAFPRWTSVISLSLTVSKSLVAKLYAIRGPFLKLEDLVLLSWNSMQLTLPSTFRWGSRLRILHLTGITFPALLLRLSSFAYLVDVHLHGNSNYMPPDLLVATLSQMAQLQSLSFHILSTTNHIAILPQSSEHVILSTVMLECGVIEHMMQHDHVVTNELFTIR